MKAWPRLAFVPLTGDPPLALGGRAAAWEGRLLAEHIGHSTEGLGTLQIY